MSDSVVREDKANSVFWLATQAGKMAVVLHEEILLCQFFCDQAFSVKVTKHMACFCVFIDVDYSCQSIKHNLERISPIPNHLDFLLQVSNMYTCIGGGAGGTGGSVTQSSHTFLWWKRCGCIWQYLRHWWLQRAHFLPLDYLRTTLKHHKAGLPKQLPTDALSQIDYWHTIHCEGCKEVCLRQQTMQRAFWKICVGVCTWLSGRKASHVWKHSTASDMCRSKLLLPWTTRVKYSLGGTYVHKEVAWHYLQSNK